jgi:hypothetical protein
LTFPGAVERSPHAVTAFSTSTTSAWAATGLASVSEKLATLSATAADPVDDDVHLKCGGSLKEGRLRRGGGGVLLVVISNVNVG